MSAMASQMTSLAIVYSTIYSRADQRKHQKYTSLAFVWGIHRWPVNSPHKGPVTRKIVPFGDVIMKPLWVYVSITHDDVIKWKHYLCYWPFCAGNSLVTGKFPSQRPVTRSFDVFHDLCLNKRLSEQWWGWCLRCHRAHYDITVMKLGPFGSQCRLQILICFCQISTVIINYYLPSVSRLQYSEWPMRSCNIT